MANKEMKELKDLTAKELEAKVREVKAALFESRMKFHTGQLENVASIWKQRKRLARMETLISQQKKTAGKEGASA